MKKTVRITQPKKRTPTKKPQKAIASPDIGVINQAFIDELRRTRQEWQFLFEKFQNAGFIRKEDLPLSNKDRWELECKDIAELRRRYLEDIFIKRYIPWWGKIVIWVQKRIWFPILSIVSRIAARRDEQKRMQKQIDTVLQKTREKYRNDALIIDTPDESDIVKTVTVNLQKAANTWNDHAEEKDIEIH